MSPKVFPKVSKAPPIKRKDIKSELGGILGGIGGASRGVRGVVGRGIKWIWAPPSRPQGPPKRPKDSQKITSKLRWPTEEPQTSPQRLQSTPG